MTTHLAGRSPGIGLTPKGVEQAQRLATRIASQPPDLIVVSPRERARETASSIAPLCPAPIQVSESFDECDFGDWTGRPFSQLSSLPDWFTYNSLRSFNSAPGGESIQQVQYRATREMIRLSATHPGSRIVVVTHADVIRSVLAYFAAMPLDLLLRWKIEPASITGIELGDDGIQILCVNA